MYKLIIKYFKQCYTMDTLPFFKAIDRYNLCENGECIKAFATDLHLQIPSCKFDILTCLCSLTHSF